MTFAQCDDDDGGGVLDGRGDGCYKATPSTNNINGSDDDHHDADHDDAEGDGDDGHKIEWNGRGSFDLQLKRRMTDDSYYYVELLLQ